MDVSVEGYARIFLRCKRYPAELPIIVQGIVHKMFRLILSKWPSSKFCISNEMHPHKYACVARGILLRICERQHEIVLTRKYRPQDYVAIEASRLEKRSANEEKGENLVENIPNRMSGRCESLEERFPQSNTRVSSFRTATLAVSWEKRARAVRLISRIKNPLNLWHVIAIGSRFLQRRRSRRSVFMTRFISKR